MPREKHERGFLLINQYDFGDDLLSMKTEEAGEIIQALVKFALRGEVTEFNDRYLSRVFKSLVQSTEANQLSYAERCEMNRLIKKIADAKKAGKDCTDLEERRSYLKENGLDEYRKKYDVRSRSFTFVLDSQQNKKKEIEKETESELEQESELEGEVEPERKSEEEPPFTAENVEKMLKQNHCLMNACSVYVILQSKGAHRNNWRSLLSEYLERMH